MAGGGRGGTVVDAGDEERRAVGKIRGDGWASVEKEKWL